MFPGRAEHRHSVRRGLLAALAVATATTLGACASTGGLVDDPADYGSPSAEIAVRTFLDAAAEADYRTMGQQFGSRDGPAEARLGIAEVEQRMVVLSHILAHEDYSLRRADRAGLGEERTRFLVEMRGTDAGNVSVPFIAVQSRNGRWFVERIDTDPLTR